MAAARGPEVAWAEEGPEKVAEHYARRERKLILNKNYLILHPWYY